VYKLLGKHSWSDLSFIARSREGWRRFVDNLFPWTHFIVNRIELN
jgi:hypothetical protein